jgi:hypothetical protein
MKSQVCEIHEWLGPFVDGELAGAEWRRVSTHLEQCADCSGEVESILAMGEALRLKADRQMPDLDGIASGVLARVRAESAQSWRRLFERAFEDSRWALVGAGSLAATFICTLFVWAVVGQGAARETDDSMAARMRNLGSHSGVLMLVASRDAGQELMYFDNGRRVIAVPYMFRSSTDSLLVGKLMDVITRDGRLMDLAMMSEAQRREAESLLQQMNPLSQPETPRPAFGALVVHELHLVADPVTVRGL